MKIIVTVPGASIQELSERTAAAWAVFREAGVDPLEAAAAQFDREEWSFTPPDVSMSQTALAAAEVWDRAVHAALYDRRPGWIEAPDSSDLELVE